MRRRNRGLSMVEIIVVMALMLLMMSILLPAAHKLIVAVHAPRASVSSLNPLGLQDQPHL